MESIILVTVLSGIGSRTADFESLRHRFERKSLQTNLALTQEVLHE